MAFVPKKPEIDMRQVDAGELLAKMQRGAIALFASELGIDPCRVLAMDYGRFSSRNNFHVLAADARALGTYLLSTGLDVPVGELAVALKLPKQVVSKLVHRGEDLRENSVADRIIRRVEEIYGVGGA